MKGIMAEMCFLHASFCSGSTFSNASDRFLFTAFGRINITRGFSFLAAPLNFPFYILFYLTFTIHITHCSLSIIERIVW